MTSGAPASSAGLGFAPPNVRYGVGMRIFADRRLLAQIRNDIARNVMQPEDIAMLENITSEVLIALLEAQPAQEGSSGARLRQFAASQAGFCVAAWRTTRKRPSRLHILDTGGLPLCGTRPGADLMSVHSGPCLGCAGRAGLDPALTGKAQPVPVSPAHSTPHGVSAATGRPESTAAADTSALRPTGLAAPRSLAGAGAVDSRSPQNPEEGS